MQCLKRPSQGNDRNGNPEKKLRKEKRKALCMFG
jgi:hypothetical protein